MRWKQRKIPTTALCSSNIVSSLHSQGKHESSSHLYMLCANTTHLGSSAGNNTPYNPRKHRTLNSTHPSCVETHTLHAYTKQCTESYVNIYFCLFLFHIIFHKQVVTEIEGVGSVMEGTVYAVDYIFFEEK
jgi:hypothetical protein